MDTDLQTHMTFFLTGERSGSHLASIKGQSLLPALFASRRHLSQLRHDFPVVLQDTAPDAAFAEPLSALMDRVLAQAVDGAGSTQGERLRQHVLRLERSLREQTFSGASGRLLALWDQTAAEWGVTDPLVAESLARARSFLTADGELQDCHAALPGRLLRHAFESTQHRYARQLAPDLTRLLLKLRHILQADVANSTVGKSAAHLQEAFGDGPLDSFDFVRMSQLLSSAVHNDPRSPGRHRRILELIAVLQSQRFVALADASADEVYPFVFESGAAALQAYRERWPELVALARAMAMAELEIKGEYNPAVHDTLFARFGAQGMEGTDLARFPDYLLCLNADTLSADEQSVLIDILATELPFKILLQTDDLTQTSPMDRGRVTLSWRCRQLASLAMTMGSVWVLQSPASHLMVMTEALQRALEYRGPALVSVFSGAAAATAEVPPYMVSAAALAARVFPAFCFDPSAGDTWAARFSLATNPQPQADEPVYSLAYADRQLQAVAQPVALTPLDFMALDARYSRHFAVMQGARWPDCLLPEPGDVHPMPHTNRTRVPWLWMVDGQDRLHKVLVDATLIRETARCRSQWRSLQELAAVSSAPLTAEADIVSSPAMLPPQTSDVAPPEAPSATPCAAPVASRPPGEAYIETPRCSTCNECIQLNPRMFAYDDNRQARIVDVTAGTYAQLVEAAESCQVSIIHPGLPRNPDEVGLEALIQRAEVFL